MRKKKGQKVPGVLWRIFKDRAQTLANTIISLIPHSPFCLRHDTLCCLQCSHENATSFLLRPDDPSGYRQLLNRCFVVVDKNAPAIADYDPVNRWPQNQVVWRTIDMIMREQWRAPNVICGGYNKNDHSSHVVELLTCSAWTLLLQRVGDDVMIYLLKHTSIFLPLPRKKHQQVTGYPINNLVPKLWKLKEVNYSGPSKKKHGVNNTNSMSEIRKHSSVFADGSMSSSSCVGCMRPGNSHYHVIKCGEKYASEAAGATIQSTSVKYENQNILKPRKRSRPFRWQRCRKRRHLDVKENLDETCSRKPIGEDSPSERLQHDFSESSSHYHFKILQPCCCRHVFQAPKSVTGGAVINRQSIFYNLEYSSSVLPQKHVLNSLKPNFAGSKSLIGSIFGLSDVNIITPSVPCFHSSGFCSIGSACLYHSLGKLLKILIRRSKCCNHDRFLDKHCAISSSRQNTIQNSNSMFEGNDLGPKVSRNSDRANALHCKTTPEFVDSQINPIESYCSKSQVVSFIWAVCRNLVPPDMLGTPSNWRILRRNIYQFIQLRRFETFSLRQCMHKLRSSGFPFLSDNFSCFMDAQLLSNAPGLRVDSRKGFNELKNAEQHLKHILLKKWIFWFFTYLVVPLVQANFYVTENEHGKHEVYYYRKSVWEKLRTRTITFLKNHYQYLDATDVRNIISNRSFGFSKLRLLPKENGVRMLANLKAPSRMPAQSFSSQFHHVEMQKKEHFGCKRVKTKYFKSVNCILRDTHAVLRGIQINKPEKLGSSVFDYNDIYRKLCPFIISLKKVLPAMPDVFIVVSDVSKAFDSIDQDQLLTIMKDDIFMDEYLLKQFFQVVCTKKCLWASENFILTNTDDGTGFRRSNSSVLYGALHAVLVNQGCRKNLKKEDLMSNLTEHVRRNVVKLDKSYYLQSIGIPQGSILSSMLCSLYYGHLERNVIFPFLERMFEPAVRCESQRQSFQDSSAMEGSSVVDKVVSSPSYILLRLIDDFLLISTSEKQAANFLTRMQRGFQDYNCYMNEEKFGINFGISAAFRLSSKRAFVGEDGVSFLRWSGLLLNSRTLEVQADYTRYLNNHLSSSLTVCWQGKPFHHLRMKLCNFMRPKCHPIFYDSNINSASVVRLNIFQAFLLCAMKFHCYVSDVSYNCNLHAKSYLKIIERSLRYMNTLIKKRTRSVHLGSYLHPVLELEKGEVEWLGLNAYIQVLSKKQSRHKKLLSLLRVKFSAHRINGSVSSQLNYAVDPSHSSLMWKIKY